MPRTGAARPIGGPFAVHVHDVGAACRDSVPLSRRPSRYEAGSAARAGRTLLQGEPIGVFTIWSPSRSVRSRTSRSRCWRRSRTRPSSPSRTPGCSRSWSSATPSFRRATARSPRRWSSRPRRPRCCGSSPRRRPTSRRVLDTHRAERRGARAMPDVPTSAAKATLIVGLAVDGRGRTRGVRWPASSPVGAARPIGR